MDSFEKEQAFDAIYIAIKHGYLEAARGAFYTILDSEVNNTLDDVISLLTRHGSTYLAEVVRGFKHGNNGVNGL